MGGMHEAVEDRVSDGGVAQIGVPLIERQLAGDDGRFQAVITFDEPSKWSARMIAQRSACRELWHAKIVAGFAHRQCASFGMFNPCLRIRSATASIASLVVFARSRMIFSVPSAEITL